MYVRSGHFPPLRLSPLRTGTQFDSSCMTSTKEHAPNRCHAFPPDVVAWWFVRLPRKRFGWLCTCTSEHQTLHDINAGTNSNKKTSFLQPHHHLVGFSSPDWASWVSAVYEEVGIVILVWRPRVMHAIGWPWDHSSCAALPIVEAKWKGAKMELKEAGNPNAPCYVTWSTISPSHHISKQFQRRKTIQSIRDRGVRVQTSQVSNDALLSSFQRPTNRITRSLDHWSSSRASADLARTTLRPISWGNCKDFRSIICLIIIQFRNYRLAL
jgi:hypothetical protein